MERFQISVREEMHLLMGNEPGLADAAANSELDRSVALTMIRVR